MKSIIGDGNMNTFPIAGGATVGHHINGRSESGYTLPLGLHVIMNAVRPDIPRTGLSFVSTVNGHKVGAERIFGMMEDLTFCRSAQRQIDGGRYG